jgi:hypothetical protein
MSLFGDLLNAENEKKEEREEKWVNFLAEIQRQLINKLERKKISLLKKQRKLKRFCFSRNKVCRLQHQKNKLVHQCKLVYQMYY